MIVTGLHKGIKLSHRPIYLSQADIFVLWLLYAFVISKEDWDAPVEERIDSLLILPSSSLPRFLLFALKTNSCACVCVSLQETKAGN